MSTHPPQSDYLCPDGCLIFCDDHYTGAQLGSPTLLIIAAGHRRASVWGIQTIQWFREFGPERPKRRIRQSEKSTSTTMTADEAERRYLEGRRAAFAAEQKLFINTELTTDIQPQYSTETEMHQQTFDDIQQAVALHKGRFVLIGDPGAGKSTALRHLTTYSINDYLEKRDNRLPVWINLGLSSNPVDAEELLQYWWDEQCYLPGEPDQYIKQKNILLFFDGLNEMPEAGGSRKQRADALHAFIESHPDLPVIVTCRVRDYEDDDILKLGLPVVYVKPLDYTRVQEFINKRSGDEKLWAAIQGSDALLRLASNPYNLVMLIEVYKQSGQLPDNLNDLYRDYVKLTYDRYTNKRTMRKDGDPDTPLLRLPFSTLEHRLKRLAFLMIVREKGTAAEYDWARNWKQWVGRTALRDGLNLGVLVREGENVRFYHQSLHGYFAIERLSRELTVKSRFDRVTKNPVALIRQIGDLGENGAPAIEPLIAALHDPLEIVRNSATNSLAQIGAPAIEPLLAALHDPLEIVRNCATNSLAQMGAPAIEPLIAALHDPLEIARNCATNSLAQMGAPAIEPLIAALHDPLEIVQNCAINALAQIGTPAIEPLIAALHDPLEIVRNSATNSLAQIGVPAIEPLIAALHDPLEIVRNSATNSLAQIGTPAIKPLIDALVDPREIVQNCAINALAQIGTPAIEPLIDALVDPRPYNSLRKVANALVQIGQPAVEPMLFALGHQDRGVRNAVADALVQIGQPAVEPMLFAIHLYYYRDYYILRDLANVLVQIGQIAVESLLTALGYPDVNVRRIAAFALGEIADPRAVGPLIAALDDHHPPVRAAAATALGQFADPSTIEPLRILLLDTNLDDIGFMRVCDHAAEALEHIGTPEALAAVEVWRREQGTGENPAS